MRTILSKVLIVAMLMIFCLGAMPAFADDSGSCGTSVTYTYTSSNHKLTISGSGAMSNYTSYSPAPWNSYKTEIQTIAINSGVTSVGNYAFYGCTNLSGFSVNNATVTSIGNYAFYNCDKLMQILDLDNLFSGLVSIGSYAFAECDGFTSVRLLKNVATVGNNAFQNCSSDTLLRIGSSVTSIGQTTFSGCTSLKTVIIEDGSLTLAFATYDKVFANCPLTTLYLGRKISYTENSNYTPFSGITALKTVTIGNQVNAIGAYLFYGCQGLTTVNIPNSVTSVGNYTFYGCLNLPSISIPNSVTAIGKYAFYKCESLSSLSIPSSVTSLGDCTFDECIALKTIRLEDGNLTLAFATYDRAFANCPITTLYLGRKISYTESSNYAPFAGKTALKNITVGNQVNAIGAYLFYGCTNLTAITIGNQVETISSYALYGCLNLPSVSIPNSVTAIGKYAFYKCESLSSLSIPSSVTSLGDCTFDECIALKTVRLEDGSLTLAFATYDKAFANCPIDNLYLGRKISYTESSSYAPFAKNTKLITLTIGKDVTSIGQYAFYNCTGLTSVTNNATTPQTINANVFGGVTISKIPLTVPAASLTKYQTANVWKDFFSINGQYTAIETIKKDNFAIFPNPVKDEIFIQSEQPIEKVEILDIAGRVVVSSNSTTANVAHLPKGVYFAKIFISNQSITKKIIKE